MINTDEILVNRMKYFSTLAGPLQKLPTGRQPYKVQFIDIKNSDSLIYRIWIQFASYSALLLLLVFEAVLFYPTHWIVVQQPDSKAFPANLLMLVCLMVLQLFVVIGTYSLTRSTLKAQDPIPVHPPKGLRVAFVTTRAPGEPVQMAKKTLIAIQKVRYKRGEVDTWLLDETNDSELRDFCQQRGIHYFTRAGIDRWNTDLKGSTVSRRKRRRAKYYAAKSKHGNFNAWRQYLAEQRIHYDVLAGVDTDHVPEPNYLQRVLGYFRDLDVAYVVGPQVYGNYRPGLVGLVARWSESQASFFQSTIQRAGNATASPMFVGTNYAVRMKALDQIGGFQPCITEDMATGLAIHSKKNPATRNQWKSIYTPDVLAVGEGPEYWGPYFTQQWRWAAGAFDTWRRMVWKLFLHLKLRSMLHYFLMLTYYPMAALTWLVGIASSLIYMVTGATAILAPWSIFVTLYLMTLIMQTSLYFWNRRYNVSPHEPEGSLGVPGMAMSALTAPVYVSAFMGILSGKKPHFVVTTKGSSENPDWFQAFRTHLQWAAVLLIAVVYAISRGHTHPAMMLWVGTQLVICIVPFVLGMLLAIPARMRYRIERKTSPVLEGEVA